MKVDDLTAIRQRLYQLGYRIIPTRGKRAMLKGWNTQEYINKELTDKKGKRTVEQRIAKWPTIPLYRNLQSTGVRIEKGLAAIDIDVDDGPIVKALLSYIKKIAPDIRVRAPMRYGGGKFKVALFVQKADEGVELAFAQLRSHKWLRPGKTSEDSKGYRVEIFGGAPARNGNCGHHMGVHGPHSYDDDDKEVKVWYRWADDRTPLYEVALTDLPTLTTAQAYQILDHFDKLAEEAGWTQVKSLDVDKDVAYDITDESRFDTNKGSRHITYDELCDEYAIHGDGLRCSANFMPGRGESGDTTHCSIGDTNRHSCISVYVHGDEVIHFPEYLKPPPNLLKEFLKNMQAVSENAKVKQNADTEPSVSASIEPSPADDPNEPPEKPPEPPVDAELGDKARWLLDCYGYHALTHTAVELFKPADDCQIRPVAFQQLYRSWHEQIIGPRGGVNYLYATSIWEMSADRINIEGVQLRPDMPFPLYQENGCTFKNTYQQPKHEGSGDIEPWLSFMEHLLPKPVEREWFCNWLAHKVRNPQIPGVACVMVATDVDVATFGAGRGLLGSIVSKLIGESYTRGLDFEMLTGATSQAQFTDWRAKALMVLVDESKSDSDSTRWSTRHAVYERLKSLIEPRAVRRTFAVKGKTEIHAYSFTSYLIATNHSDAVQIPANDRRFTVLSNGLSITEDKAENIVTWMNQPGNIAELERWLDARDLNGFSAYTPLPTEAKTLMAELSRTDNDDAWSLIKTRVGKTALFTGEQIVAAVQTELNDYTSMNDIKRWVNRRIKAEAMKVTQNYRMPRPTRHWILCWRGCDQKLLPLIHSEAAQRSVEITGKRLQEDNPSTIGAAILSLKQPDDDDDEEK